MAKRKPILIVRPGKKRSRAPAKPKPPPRPATSGKGAPAPWFRTDVALAVALGVVVGLFACYKLVNMDIWWHLKTGQVIWEQKSPPFADPFMTGFQQTGTLYVDLHWLFQLLVFGIHSLTGVPGLVWMKMAVAVAAVMIATRLVHGPARPVVAYWCWMPALYLVQLRMIVRPELFTLLYVAVFLVVLEHARRRPRLVWLLPAVQVVWVNTQGLFILGPVLMAMWWVDHAARQRLGLAHADKLPKREQRPLVKRMAVVSGAVVAACLISPYHVHGLLFPLELAGKVSGSLQLDEAAYSKTISEFRTLWSHGWGDFSCMLGVGLVVLCVVSFVLNRGRLSVFRLLAAAAFAVLGFQAIRNVSLLGLVVGAVTAANLAEFAHDAPRQWKRLKRLPRWWPIAVRAGLVAVMLFSTYVLATDRFYAWRGDPRRFGIGTTPLLYATEAARFIGREGLPKRVLAVSFGQAAVVIHELAPPYQVFMDGRLELNSREQFKAYMDVTQAIADDWRRGPALLDRLGIQVVLVWHEQIDCEVGLMAHPAWTCVWYDPVASVFLHHQPEHASLLHGYGPDEYDKDYLAAKHYAEPPLPAEAPSAPPEPGWLGRLLSPAPPRSAEFQETLYLNRTCKRLLGKGAARPEQVRGLSLMALRRGQQALRQAPRSAGMHLLLGTTYLMSQPPSWAQKPPLVQRPWSTRQMLHMAQAAHHMRQALRFSPNDFSSLLPMRGFMASIGARDEAVALLARIGQTAIPADSRNRESIERALQQLPLEQGQIRTQVDELKLRESWANLAELDARSRRARQSGLAGEAARLIDRAVGGGKMDWARADEQATLWLLLGYPERAMRIYTQQLQNDAPADRVAERIATVLLVQGHYGKAAAHGVQALKLNPRNVDAFWGLTCLYQQLGDARKALSLCRKALSTTPMTPEEQKAFRELEAHLKRYVP